MSHKHEIVFLSQISSAIERYNTYTVVIAVGVTVIATTDSGGCSDCSSNITAVTSQS